MKFFYKIIIVGVAVALSAGSIPPSFADGFQPPLFKWLYEPTICALEPSDPKFPGLGQKMLSAVQYAVLDWQTKLNGGNGRNGLWDLNLIEIQFSETNSYDTTKCDITVNFKPSPDDPNEKFTEAGVTTYKDFPKVYVTIYYLGVDIHEQYVTFWQNGTLYYTYQSTPYFTGYLASDPQLSMTLLHELGHSLGLGHYIVSDTELAQIIQGRQDMPSIMIPTVITYGVTQFGITPLDMKEIQSIYGTNGLPVPQSNPPVSNLLNVTSSTTDNQSQTSVNQTQTVTSLPSQIPSWVKNIAKWWSVNQVSDNEFVSAMKYLIQQKILQVPDTPSSSISGQIPSWVKTNAGYWADGKISDSAFIRGIQYLISAGILNL